MKTRLTAIRRAILVLVLAVVATPALAGDLIASSDWKASVDRSQPKRPQLVITARLVLPTPGYRIRMKLASMMKSHPPVPIYDLVLTAPTGPVAQVITHVNFRHVEPIAGPVYRTVVIRHEGKTIARLEVDDGAK